MSGLIYNYLPFMVLPIYASLERLDTRLMEAAKDLYANAAHDLLQSHPAALGARGGRGDAAHLHPGDR